ncbi:TPA: hypothetical protein ACITHQ_001190 [Salmonella enterica subsp. enterica serovar Saintpaul]|uniref:Uncharacterized protein n=1 Tax=Salmonella typhimurium TaxID=90371 RepID=A0A740YBG9_SALTM|nr:hypothetical protein [Salmonella enterica]HAF0508278.1 hypothetical protein [Salmonella enterica subsp. enterica serovar Typhimurium]HAT4910186.1 hypothetical protein [Salmonella enterica subsp. enterica serovar Typhimurium]
MTEKQYPSEQYLKELLSNTGFASAAPVEVVRCMAKELLKYREAKPVAFTEKHEISNMEATGLYIRAWPGDRSRNEIEGYTIPLYTR